MGIGSISIGRAGPWKPQYTVLSFCLISYFSIRFSQVLIGPIVPFVVTEFTVTHGQIGIALSGMWVAYACLQLPSGIFADRFGGYPVVLLALALTIGAVLLLASAPVFLVFGAATLMLGAGAGLYYNPATALLTRTFDEIGGAIGTHRIGGQIAGVSAPAVAAVVSVRFGWRITVLIGGAIVAIAVGIGLLKPMYRQPTRPGASIRELFGIRTFWRILRQPHNRNTTVMAALVNFVELAAMAFIPIFLIEQYGVSVRLASILFAVFFAVSAVCQPLSGAASDRIGRDNTILLLALLGVSGYGGLSLTTIPFIIPFVVLAGISLSATPVLQARIMDNLDSKHQGKGFGLFRMCYLLVGATGTAVVGITADMGGWTVAFGLLSMFWIVVFILLARIQLRG